MPSGKSFRNQSSWWQKRYNYCNAGEILVRGQVHSLADNPFDEPVEEVGLVVKDLAEELPRLTHISWRVIEQPEAYIEQQERVDIEVAQIESLLNVIKLEVPQLAAKAQLPVRVGGFWAQAHSVAHPWLLSSQLLNWAQDCLGEKLHQLTLQLEPNLKRQVEIILERKHGHHGRLIEEVGEDWSLGADLWAEAWGDKESGGELCGVAASEWEEFEVD